MEYSAKRTLAMLPLLLLPLLLLLLLLTLRLFACVFVCSVHPDPLDGFALATYASSTGRTAELMPLQHIEKSTHFAGPFAVPSAALFEAYCQDLVQRYCLEDSVIQGKVGCHCVI